nr:cell division cycle and apoptosis regulator protein 1 [Ipomoea batatas]
MISQEVKVSPKVKTSPTATQETKAEEATTVAVSKMESVNSQNDDCSKLEIKEQPKEEKERTDKKDERDVPKSKSIKEVKEKKSEEPQSKSIKEVKEKKSEEPQGKSIKELKEKKSEEPPRHPGFILKTEGSKNHKLRSLSLSLDSLLDYTDKDVEDSRFELSLFAESIYEMLYYEMGLRLLSFLQDLRIKFVIKRNQRKREREEASKKESEEKPLTKRAKTEECADDTELTGVEKQNKTNPDEKMAPVKEEPSSPVKTQDTKMTQDEAVQNESDEDEDPEEDPEEENVEDVEMPDADPQNDADQENVEGRTNTDSKSENVAEDEKDEKPVMGVEASKLNADLDIGSKDNKIIKVETEAKGAQGEVNRDLLQAIFLNTVFSCAFILPFLHFIIVMVFLFGNRLSGFLIETE